MKGKPIDVTLSASKQQPERLGVAEGDTAQQLVVRENRI
jgi:hypothetical protein